MGFRGELSLLALYTPCNNRKAMVCATHCQREWKIDPSLFLF